MTAAEKKAIADAEAARIAAEKKTADDAEAARVAGEQTAADVARQGEAQNLPADKQLSEAGAASLADDIEQANKPIISILSTDNPLPTLVGAAPKPEAAAEAEPVALETETKQLLKQFGLKRAIIEKSTDIVTFDETLIAKLLEKDADAYTIISA